MPAARRAWGIALAQSGGVYLCSSLTPMTNPTALERARVARASGRSGHRSASSIRRALAPIDLLLDLLGFLLSPLGWAMKAMRERIGALLAYKLAAQLRRTLAHAGIPIPALSDRELIFWVSRTKPLLRDKTPSPAGGKPKGMSGACAQQDDSISNAPSPLAPLSPFAREGLGAAPVSDHPHTAHLPQLSGAEERSRIRGPPWPAPTPQPQTALAHAKRGRWRWLQLRQRNVAGSSGLTKARPSSCAAAHSFFSRRYHFACTSMSSIHNIDWVNARP
jgi:hypothetical protein